MRTQLLLGPALAFAAVATLVFGAGPAAGTTAGMSLATPAAVSHYLSSLGIDPRGVVVQRGAHNYAGPRCPGKGWRCTAATRVLQLGTSNQYECTGTPGSGTTPDQTCTIVQGGASNSATCKEYETVDVGSQDCNITQTGANNSATVTQSITSNGGPTQHAVQTAEVTQSGATVKNAFKLVQAINQTTKALGPTTQTQDAFQSVTLDQSAGGKGVNSADQHQTQIQKEQDGTTQLQNTLSDGPPDCDPNEPPDAPNQCARVTQNSELGNNGNSLDQSISEDEHSQFATTQTQGSDAGGIDGGVHLVSVSGASNNNAHEKKVQAVAGPAGATQMQIDPMGCCGFSAEGNANSKETVDQSSTQHASGPAASQQLSIFGTANTNGSCTISQKGSNNSDSSGGSLTESPCPFAEQDTFCTSGEGGCFTIVPDFGDGFLERRLFAARR